jgi:amino acid adenylation domain-containing protein
MSERQRGRAVSLPWLPGPGARAAGPVDVAFPATVAVEDRLLATLTAWAVLLYHHSGDQAPVIGLQHGTAPVAVRLRVDPERPIGWPVDVVEVEGEPLPLVVRASPGPVAPRALTLVLTPTGLQLHHDPEIHDADAVARHAGHVARVLAVLAEEPDRPVRAVDPLTAPERARVVEEWNDTAACYPDARIEQIFAQRVAAAPDAPAVVHRGTMLSYAELDRRSDRLAVDLQANGLRPDERVALLLPREPGLVVAALGVLKAGGVYVPIDPALPRERRDDLLAGCGSPHTVTSDGVAALDGCVDTGKPVPPASGPGSPAYLMYTSGTTGRPKGVLVPHRGVVRLVSAPGYVRLDATTRTAQIGATGFDASVWEIWATLLGGGCLHILDRETVLDAAELARELASRRITTALFTSALFNQLADADPTLFRPLRDLLVGGDVLAPAQARAVLRANPGLRLVNAYGPTENAVISTCHVVTEPVGDRVPIGVPVPNTVAYVLNQDRLPLPTGVPGELYVGGDGIALGYLGHVDAGAFVPDPFRPGATLYRTGDRARRLPDGSIDFLGRLDDQLKIRGFRVEPGEVEAALLRNPAVRAAAVVARRLPGGSDAQLCAYVVTDSTPEEVRAHARRQLPAHMVPSHVVVLPALPLTATGKVDRAALPQPRPGGPPVVARPADDVERALVDLWEQVLGVTGIGIADELDLLGAGSLTATRVAAEVRRRFGVPCPVAVVLAAPTVTRLAAHIREAAVADVRGPQPGQGGGRAPLSPQQRRIYVEQMKDRDGTQYNLPIVVDLPDAPDRRRLLATFSELVARHEILRTDIGVDAAGVPYQRVHDDVPVGLSSADPWVVPFDPHRAPLWRVAVRDHRLLLDVHHLLTDGVSLTLLLREWAALCRGEELWRGEDLPAPGMRYRDYAHWTGGPEFARVVAEQRDFWAAALLPPPRVPDLPTDFVRPPVRRTEGAYLAFPLGEARSRGVRALARSEGRTPFQVLLAAYAALLARICGSEDVTVGTPVSGRHLPGVDRAQGPFVNTLCLRFHPRKELPFRAHLQLVAEHAVAAADHQDHPFDDLVRMAGAHDPSRHPLFDTFFAVQDTGLGDVDLLGGTPRWQPEATGRTIFDLNLQIEDGPRGYEARWGYSTSLFRRSTVELLRDELLRLLDAVLADPDAPLERPRATAPDPPDIVFNL